MVAGLPVLVNVVANLVCSVSCLVVKQEGIVTGGSLGPVTKQLRDDAETYARRGPNAGKGSSQVVDLDIR